MLSCHPFHRTLFPNPESRKTNEKGERRPKIMSDNEGKVQKGKGARARGKIPTEIVMGQARVGDKQSIEGTHNRHGRC